jgi:gas vesicle protein
MTTSSDPDVIRAQIEQTRENLSDNVNALADEVNPKTMVHRQTQKVTGAFGSVKERVMGTASSAQGAAGDTVHSVGNAAASAPTQVAQRTQGNPMAAGLIAFGAGLLVASLLPATDKEREVADQVKDKAQPLVEEAKGVAQDAADHLKPAAQEAAQSVKQAAQDAASTVKDEGQSAAGDVRDDAQQAKQNVQES